MTNKEAAQLRSAILSSLLAALTAALSFVAIPVPMSPVPVTGQTFGVMLAGLVLGPWWGAASMLVYLAIGVLGFPVFAGGRAGLGSLAGPTGGYLAGFVVGAWATGVFARLSAASRPSGLLRDRGRPDYRKQEFWLGFAAALFGGVAVHALGSVWLALSTGRTANEAFALGSAPFILGDVLKAVGAALAAIKIRSAGRARWTWMEAEGSATRSADYR